MDIKQVAQPLNRFIRRLPPSLKVDEVIIFGSYFHGQATEDSDIDVLVVSDDFQTMDVDERDDMLYRASRDIEPVIEPWGFTHQELNRFGPLSTAGYARDKGIRFVKGGRRVRG